ncbi:MAG: hypothetical protein J6V03_02240 [Clostridia bacterium]|nr:hypothetical protein [Clostridia bacterium]
MIIFKIVSLCIISLVLVMFLKGTSPQFAAIVSIVSGIMIFIYISPYINNLLLQFSGFVSLAKDFKWIFEKIIKITTIAIVCEFASQLCIDVGEGFLANKIYLAGKVVILGVISTDIISFVNYVIELINNL